jgi:hypothetical protein
LRWWQRLVATRLLEHDADGRLVWDAAVWTVARQVGKSWLLRELCLWRDASDGPVRGAAGCRAYGKDLGVCREVQRPALWWAREQGPGVYHIRQTNGQEALEWCGPVTVD